MLSALKMGMSLLLCLVVVYSKDTLYNDSAVQSREQKRKKFNEDTCGVALIIISNIQTTESVSCPPNNGIYEGVKYTGSESYSEIRSIGPIRCFHECSLFTGCTFVNYDKMQFICYLFNTELNETSVKPDVGFAIMHNISQDKEIMGHCLNHACKNREQCISLRNSSACLRSGCRHKHYLLDDKKRICYRIVDTVNLTWSNAEKYCKNDGGHLITLDVEDKNRFISNALQSCVKWEVRCGGLTCVEVHLLLFRYEIIKFYTLSPGQEKTYIKYTVNSGRYWIGLHDRTVEGNFHWIGGTQLDNNSFVSWGRYQPNNIGHRFLTRNADCCTMESDGSWSDDDCNDLKRFICEITL